MRTSRATLERHTHGHEPVIGIPSKRPISHRRATPASHKRIHGTRNTFVHNMPEAESISAAVESASPKHPVNISAEETQTGYERRVLPARTKAERLYIPFSN